MAQLRDVDDVHEPLKLADVCQVSGDKIGVIDLGCHGKLTNTEISCFKSAPIDRVIHFPQCISKSDTMLGSHGFSCASVISGARRGVNFLDMCKHVIEGIFPNAQLYTYAIGCGTCRAPMRLAKTAMDLAVEDGVKVISMSISDTLQNIGKIHHPKNDIVGMKTLELFEKGILTCTAIGNAGPTEKTALYGWPWSFIVGACTSKRISVTDIEIAIDEYVPSIKILDTICDENANFMITHKLKGASFNVIDTKFLTLRVRQSEEWSHERVLIRDMTSGLTCSLLPVEPTHRKQIWSPFVSSTSMVLLSKEDVNQLRTLHTKLLGKKMYVRFFKSKFIDDERGVFVPEFSSRGPSRLYKDHIVPDVVAPGHAVCMSYPCNIPLIYHKFKPTTAMDDVSRVEEMICQFSDNTISSGTSFACPYVAACAMAVRSRYPKWNPSAVKSALITTAKSFAAEFIPGNEFAFGAGSINLESALRPGLVYEESHSRFVEYVNGGCEICDLNLPTFAASFSCSYEKCVKKFKRKLKNVNLDQKGDLVYTHDVVYFHKTLDPHVRITVDPPYLEFKPDQEENEFFLSVEIFPYPGPGLYVSAMLKWIPKEGGGQSVCSPIHLYPHY